VTDEADGTRASERIRELEARVAHLTAELERRTREHEDAVRGLSAAADRLRVSEERFAKAFHASPDAININRARDGVYVAISQAFTSVMGYTEGDVLGVSSLALGIWDDPRDRKRLVAALGEEGRVDGLRARFRTKSGGVIRGLMAARLLEIDGEPCILSITRDVTAQEEADEALRRSEEYLRMTIDLAADGIVLGDAEGRISRINARVEEITGRVAGELVGRPLAALFAPESLASTPLRFDLVGQGLTVVRERDVLRPDGTRVPVETSSRRMPDGTHQSILRDLTERRREAQERARLERRLEMAARVEAVGRLASGVAHDFNNLLTPILAISTALQTDPTVPHAAREDLAAVAAAADQAAALTRQVLALGRERVLAISSLDVNGLVHEMERLLVRVIGDDVRVVLDLAADVPAVAADAAHLQQVLLNLVVNARDAMPEGGTLTIRTAYLSAEEGSELAADFRPARGAVRLDVTDTGIGMSGETRARVFDPFFTTKEPGRGTGLGLATVRSIVSRYDGVVAVRSEEGHGSTFSVALPVPAALSAVAANEAEPTGTGGSPARILVVEDETLVRSVVAEMLSADGHEVVAVESARAALAALDGGMSSPDLLLADVGLQDLDGHELATRVEAAVPGVRVLLMSGGAMEGGRESGRAHLAKPFTSAELRSRVAEALAGRSSR
jgi:two-component system cell cycle sensor histidine kinase/response regulator CckA